MRNKKFNLTSIILITYLLFAGLIGLVSAHGGEITNSNNENMMSDVNGSMFGMGFFGWILIIVIIIALVIFIIWMIKNLKGNKK